MPILRETLDLNADTPKNRHHENPPRFISVPVTSLPNAGVYFCPASWLHFGVPRAFRKVKEPHKTSCCSRKSRSSSVIASCKDYLPTRQSPLIYTAPQSCLSLSPPPMHAYSVSAVHHEEYLRTNESQGQQDSKGHSMLHLRPPELSYIEGFRFTKEPLCSSHQCGSKSDDRQGRKHPPARCQAQRHQKYRLS
jgi:hypothetical protein